MEVKPISDGYKKTVAGVIPNDWSVRRMGGIARVVSGQVDPRIEPYSLMPLVAPDHIASGTGRLERSIPTAAEQRAISGKYLFRSGTVIYSKIRPHLRKVCIAPFDGLCSADMYPLLPADDVHPGFLFASLLSERFSKYAESVSIRSGMPKINREELAGFEFVLPSTRQEQAQIAETLADADALIDSLEQLLTKKRQIKQGAMQELLTGKRRLPGFHAAWKTSTVGIEFEVELGKMLDSERNTGLLKPYLGNRAVQWGRIDTSDVQTMPFAPSELERYRLRKGDLLVCEGGEVGRAAIWDSQLGECYYQKALHRLRPLRGYDPNLMLQFLKLWSDIGGLDNFVTQTSIAHLPRETLLEIPLPLPDLNEQAALVQVMSEMDAEIEVLESRLTKARALKQAMAQALLTGRIRLVEPTA